MAMVYARQAAISTPKRWTVKGRPQRHGQKPGRGESCGRL